MFMVSAEPAHSAEKIEFKNSKGQEVLIIKAKKDGYKLVDGKQKLLARYTVKDTRLKIKDGSGALLGVVSGNAQKLKIKINKRTAYFIKAQAKGGFKVKDGDENLLYKLNPKNYGFKINNHDAKVIGKVKNNDNKIKIEAPEGQLQYTTKSRLSNLAAASLAYEKLALPLRIGILLQLNGT